MSLREITCWKRWSESLQRWEFNHIEYGWVHYNQTQPTPKFDSQRGWLRAEWQKRRVYLNESNQVVNGRSE